MMGSHPRHRRWKHSFLAALLVAAVCLVAAGCSSGTPTPTGTSPAGSSPVTATSAPAAAPSPSAAATASTPNSTAPVRAQLEAWTGPAPRYRTIGAAVGDSVFLLRGLNAHGVSSSDGYRIQPLTGKVVLAGRLATPAHCP